MIRTVEMFDPQLVRLAKLVICNAPIRRIFIEIDGA
jgi:hypothetical protein